MAQATGREAAPARNRAAFARIELAPRTGLDMGRLDPSVALLVQRLAAPLAFAPIGMGGAIWPGAPALLAAAARDSGIARMTGTRATAPREAPAAILPGRLWFRPYSFPDDDHRLSAAPAERAARAASGRASEPGECRRERMGECVRRP